MPPQGVMGGAPGGGGGGGAVWTPDMGIRFGGPPSQAAGAAGYPQPRRPGAGNTPFT